METTDAAAWVRGLRTNEEDNPDVSGMVEFGTELTRATPDTFGQVLGEWMDVSQLARYFAVEQAIGHWDGTAAWYGNMGSFVNHNYYLYEHTDQQRVTLVTWDLDNTVSSVGSPNPLSGYGVPEWNDLWANCDPVPIPWGNARAAPCDPFFHHFVEIFWPEYVAASRAFLEGPFDAGRIQGIIDEYAALVADTVAEDPHGPGAADFDRGVAELTDAIDELHARVSATW